MEVIKGTKYTIIANCPFCSTRPFRRSITCRVFVKQEEEVKKTKKSW